MCPNRALDKFINGGYTLSITKGAAGRRLAPKRLFQKEVTAWSRSRRLLLFIGLKKQAANTDDNKAKLQNFGCTHGQPPFREIRGQKEAAPMTGPTAYRFTGSAINSIADVSTESKNKKHRPRCYQHRGRQCANISPNNHERRNEGRSLPPAPFHYTTEGRGWQDERSILLWQHTPNGEIRI